MSIFTNGTVACECYKTLKSPVIEGTKIAYMNEKCNRCKKSKIVFITHNKNKKGERKIVYLDDEQNKQKGCK
jgi:hypothetical protein